MVNSMWNKFTSVFCLLLQFFIFSLSMNLFPVLVTLSVLFRFQAYASQFVSSPGFGLSVFQFSRLRPVSFQASACQSFSLPGLSLSASQTFACQAFSPLRLGLSVFQDSACQAFSLSSFGLLVFQFRPVSFSVF